jgi:lysozyme family protein/uncharacterized protein YvpB
MTETDPFDLALAFTLKWEGGEGHSQDLAGAVNRGISQDTYDTYRQGKGLSPKSVSQITDAEVVIVYRSLFWDRCHAEFMCLPLAIAHFDTAVNFSVRGSIEFLQETLGLTIDGDFGSATEAALQKQNNLTTAKRYCENRMAYRHHRVKQTPSQEIFLEGWLRRDRDLWEYISQQENFQPKNINLNSSIEQTGKSMKLEDFVGTEKKYDVKAIAADIELTEQIQGRLIDLGLMAPPVDGIFGPVSSASLKRFQELMNCGEPNFLGAKTAQYLLEATPDSISGDAPTLYTTRNTVFKARPIQSTQLSDAEKESVDGGKSFILNNFDVERNHIRITLRHDSFKGIKVWYVYGPHAEIFEGNQKVYPNPKPQTVKLNVPYKSQLDNYYNPTGSCNVTSLAMCMQYLGIPRRDNIGQYEDELYEYALYNGLSRHDPWDLAKIVRDYGGKDTFKPNATIEELQEWLAGGNPAVIHGYFTSFGHIVAVVGYTSSGFYVHDPYGEWFSTGYRTDLPGNFLHYSYNMIRATCIPDGSFWVHFISK